MNEWLTEVQVDEHPQNGRISLGLSINVKITLKDGTYHEVNRPLSFTQYISHKSRTSATALQRMRKPKAPHSKKQRKRQQQTVLNVLSEHSATYWAIVSMIKNI